MKKRIFLLVFLFGTYLTCQAEPASVATDPNKPSTVKQWYDTSKQKAQEKWPAVKEESKGVWEKTKDKSKEWYQDVKDKLQGNPPKPNQPVAPKR